jgi:hypothetical protein
VVILANFNFSILKLHQRNVYNLHLLLFLTSEGKDVNKCIVVDNDSLSKRVGFLVRTFRGFKQVFLLHLHHKLLQYIYAGC